MRSSLCKVMIVLLLVAVPAFASTPCCAGKCLGHNYANGGTYAWQETINTGIVTVGSTETSLMPACSRQNELRADVQFNALLRASIRIDCVNGMPAGARYGLRFYVDGVERGGATRFIRMQGGASTASLVPQGDVFNAIALNLSPGSHVLDVKAYVVDGGTMQIGNVWVSAQGAPVNYVGGANVTGGRVVTDASATITPSWAPITASLRISNNTNQYVDVYPQAYFQFQGGTPGDRVEVGFRYKLATDSIYPPSARTSDFTVPCPLKDGQGNCYWPSVDTARDGINMSDHIFNLPPGDWDVILYAINQNAHTTTVGFRELEFLYFLPNGTKADYQRINTVTIVDSETTEPQPIAPSIDPCAKWTKLAEVTVPYESGESFNIGEVYVQLLGRGIDDAETGAGDWTFPDIEIMTVMSTGVAILEWGGTLRALPSAKTGVSGTGVNWSPVTGWYYPIESGPVVVVSPGATYTLWARKRTGSCAFTTCQNRGTSTPTKFRVGNIYFSVRRIASNPSCIEYDGYYNGTDCPLQ